MHKFRIVISDKCYFIEADKESDAFAKAIDIHISSIKESIEVNKDFNIESIENEILVDTKKDIGAKLNQMSFVISRLNDYLNDKDIMKSDKLKERFKSTDLFKSITNLTSKFSNIKNISDYLDDLGDEIEND